MKFLVGNFKIGQDQIYEKENDSRVFVKKIGTVEIDTSRKTNEADIIEQNEMMKDQ